MRELYSGHVTLDGPMRGRGCSLRDPSMLKLLTVGTDGGMLKLCHQAGIFSVKLKERFFQMALN